MAKASSVISRKGKLCSVAMNQIRSRTMAPPMALLIACRPGSMIGLELIAGRMMPISGPSALSTLGGSFACSLPKAITEPEKVMAPMMMPRPISSRER